MNFWLSGEELTDATNIVGPGKRIHIVGIGGAGMSGIARVLLESGVRVSGSDRSLNDVTQALQRDGAIVHEGHRPENIEGAGMVLATSAAKEDNPEVAAARAAGIPVMNRREFLKYILPGKTQIAVAGTHGKTTTTALIVHLLRETGQDPSYIVGGIMTNTGNNAHAGKGDVFVIEADEYGEMFLGLRPKIAVITNIEYDHPDIFASIDDVLAAFRRFVALLPDDGVLIACADDPLALSLVTERKAAGNRAMTYGLDNLDADWVGFFDEPTLTEHFRLRGPLYEFVQHPPIPALPGRHNILNAVAAVAAVSEVGVSARSSLPFLTTFRGTGRRFERIGDANGILVISDYGHHPTAIRATLQAARERYPDSRIWAVWQPHTYSRTSRLAHEFVTAFHDADHVLITDIYAAREQPSAQDTTPPDLAHLTTVSGHASAHFKGATYSGNLESTAALLYKEVRPGDVVIIFSAGDGPKIGEWLLKSIREAKHGSKSTAYEGLRSIVGNAFRLNEPLDRYTVARLGGPADALVAAKTTDELVKVFELACERHWPVKVLGGGANILISDKGFRGLVIINDTRATSFYDDGVVVADSGVGLIHLARETIQRGFAGLEWMIGIPGTVGGAIVNNAGAHGGDIAGVLTEVAVLIPPDQAVAWSVALLNYSYRDSVLKRFYKPFLVLNGKLKLTPGFARAELQAKADEYNAHRKGTQPPGASLGSMFKNPPGDYAGRLIEGAGLKGRQVGGVMISPIHANFFINLGGGSSGDYLSLIRLARDTVRDRFGVNLELEIELMGEGIDLIEG